MTFPSNFPNNPYEGQIFYHAKTKKTYECQCRDPLDRMVNLHKTLFEWVDISKEV